MSEADNIENFRLVTRIQELQSELSASQAREAELREKMADREAAFEARTIDFNSAYNANITYAEQVRELKRESAELRKLLEESKVPEGWSISKLKTCYTLSHGNEVIATLAGPDAEKHAATIAAMLSAQPKEPKQ